ncbi:Maf-like protein [Jannaschia sp. Os4]|uniref:Maf family protein n=1 Tax=Jannaschia sp. Os4 TaxID=2807617 RepID=UPI001939C99D|nr:nucleoside triphosphate pyrophosphatase [Jannaschia sp. Os4]MBM2575547.1 Maf-like protein [Jannaschia sp. Os4]
MLVLASGSATRRQMLEAARIPHEVRPARIDEAMVRDSLVAEGAPPRDVADKLAEMKALSVRAPLVLGSDQVLAHEGGLLSKPDSPEQALDHLRRLRGSTHELHSAAVIVEEGRPTWRHVSRARLTMWDVPDDWLTAYVDRNWDDIRHSVGGYLIEAEGVRLFDRIDGDHFTILGMPLIPLLRHLHIRGYA